MQTSLATAAAGLGRAGRGETLRRRRRILLCAPPLLLLTTAMAFYGLGQVLEARVAYLGGFLFYWCFWCLGFPLWLLGPSRLVRLIRRPRSTRAAVIACLPLLFAYAYVFPRALAGADAVLVATSFLLATVNGALEEMLWRGTYLALFPRSLRLGWLYPSIAFGIWHLAPQLLVPSAHPGGPAAFVAVATILGLVWGWAARRARSLLPGMISHVLFDFSGLGARAFLP
jgi:membrane protease YdiL (CAAX protease family)